MQFKRDQLSEVSTALTGATAKKSLFRLHVEYITKSNEEDFRMSMGLE
jgi:hypothetical protein